MGMTTYSAYIDNTAYTFGFLLLYLIQMLAMLVYITSIVFSEEWGNFDIVLSCLSSAILVSAELYALTMFQVTFETQKNEERVEGRNEAKRKNLCA